MNKQDDLLRPTLAGLGAARTSIYSMTTGYVAAFLGGPVAAAIVALTNSWRLRRLSKDWFIAPLALGAEGAFLYWQLHGDRAWLQQSLGSGGSRLLQRLLGVAFFGIAYLLHRIYYRNMSVVGVASPSGWLLGAVAIVVGAATHYFAGIWMAS